MLLSAVSLTGATGLLGWRALGLEPSAASPPGRPPIGRRRFTSQAVEATIVATKARISDPEIARMFEQCFPSTLDTTVFAGTYQGTPDTYVITGDIEGQWLRDSSAQVWPYLPLVAHDEHLKRMIEGVVRRQARLVLLDPYANAFTRNQTDPPLRWSLKDQTELKPGVAERKWEVDSLCYVLRLAHGFWKVTGEVALFDAQWRQAAWTILRTFREQQRIHGKGPYHFQRETRDPHDTLDGNGYGTPVLPNGMICSMFRPSDDACTFSFLIPSNLFAVAQLGNLAELAGAGLHDLKLATEATALQNEVRQGLERFGRVQHPDLGLIWAYEVDGFGNTLMMDDANIPSLLSLPYLGCCSNADPLYRNTRRFILGSHNPYFIRGTAAEGVGGPHVGADFIWPMSIILRGLTSDDEAEIGLCLRMLRDTTAGTGFMHESFHKDNAHDFTRKWFAWANTLFGEFILKVAAEHPGLLTRLSVTSSSKR